MRQLGWVPALISLGSLALQPTLVGAQGETKIHEGGRCAIRGQCGKQSIFGGELPCPDNDLAHQPEDSTRQKLVNLCGPKWEEGPVCCREEQVRSVPILPLRRGRLCGSSADLPCIVRLIHLART